MNGIVDLIRSRRSIRKFLPTVVESEKIDLLMKAALMSPTSKNSKSWQFIVVDDAAVLQKLATSRPTSSTMLANAPLAIVVLADPEKSDAWLEDASIASAFIQLQAEAIGLGSCWVQIARRPHDNSVSAEEYIRELLGVPDELNVVNVIAIGYKNEARNLYDFDRLPYDKIHRNSY